MATGQGEATIDFGSFPGTNEAYVDVVGLTTISATSKVEAYVMGDDTTVDHTAADHRWFAALAGLTCGTPVAATSVRIYARCIEKLQGQWKLRFVWAD
jgi:hypothetical protein